jgi:hypothetical protein
MFGTSNAALNYSLCGGQYNHCVIFGVFLRVICVCIAGICGICWNVTSAIYNVFQDADTDNA